MLEVAYILVAIALIVCLVYLTITIQKAGRMIDETEKTIKTFEFRCERYLASDQ